MPDLPIDSRFTIPDRELRVTTSRSGGPGGQHVNTTDTKVRLHFNLTDTTAFPEPIRERLLHKLAGDLNKHGELVITAGNSRSQHDNLAEARARLRKTLAKALERRKRRKKTKRTHGSERRRLKKKKARSDIKKSRQKPSRHD